MNYICIYLVIQAAFFAAFAWLSNDVADTFSYKLVKRFSPGEEDKFVIETKDVNDFIEQYSKVNKYLLIYTIAKLLSKGSLILALIIYVICFTFSMFS